MFDDLNKRLSVSFICDTNIAIPLEIFYKLSILCAAMEQKIWRFLNPRMYVDIIFDPNK